MFSYQFRISISIVIFISLPLITALFNGPVDKAAEQDARI